MGEAYRRQSVEQPVATHYRRDRDRDHRAARHERAGAQSHGWTLARAHARSGDPVAIAAYLGGSDEFDDSIVDFAKRYADQNERDYQEFIDAINSGRLDATPGL
jgi:sugar/nucleoside kinase (ribokinase family)